MRRIDLWFGFSITGLLILMCSSSPEPRDIQLENGMKVVMMEKRDRDVATVLMVVKAGSLYESDSTHGISNITARCLFETTRNFPNIQWELDSYGTEFYRTANQDFSSFAVNTATDYLEKVLDIFTDVIKYSQFPDTIVQSVKQDVLFELESAESNLVLQNVQNFLKMIFKVHPYRRLPLGRKETVSQFSAQDVERYFKDRFIPENISLIIVGNIRSRQVEQYLIKSLNTFSRKPVSSYTWKQEPEQREPRIMYQTQNTTPNIALITLGWRAPAIENRDTFTFDVILRTLYGGRQGRLITQVKDPLSSVYHVEAQYVTPREPGYFFINAVCQSDSVERVKERVMEEIGILRKDSITPNELNTAKAIIKAGQAYYGESTYGIAYGHLGYWTVVRNYEFAHQYLPGILSVTLDDVQSAAQRYLRDDNYTMVITVQGQQEK